MVRGDLVVLGEGDRVPADGLLRRGIHLSVDESLLTGESVPVRKVPAPEATGMDAPGGDDLPSVFSGTLVTAGQGVAEILATGPRSELGKIGKALARVEPEPTLLQRQTGRLVRTFALVGLLACALVVVAFALTRGGGVGVWKQGLLAGIALAMAILPEEFPVVLTVFLALGAWRISRSQVLTRRMPAIEMLGAATVLCVDKTGTLTRNQMTLRKVATPEVTSDLAASGEPLPEAAQAVLEHAVLASQRDPFDPMERALHVAAEQRLPGVERRHTDWELVREYPLAPGLLAVTHAWARGAEDEAVVATKGAPEAVAELCHLSAAAQERLLARRWRRWPREGLRVLGGGPRDRERRTSCPTSTTTSRSSSSAWWRSRIRSGRACRPRSRSARPPACAW